ncbi:MAG: FAD-dependent oxidoreductase [Gammaproteobacteria bacterium]|nr:FAD-dependent oxidoreductase [Gammaproteobacteria bacterium]
MNSLSRRRFIHLLGAAGSVTALGTMGLTLGGCSGGKPGAGPRVVVVGGGFGGATCAKYLRRFNPSIQVTLVERDARFVTCPFSNAVLGGLQDMNSIQHTYDALRTQHGVNVLQDEVTAIDPAGNRVSLQNGGELEYDRLVVSPGVDLRWNDVEGLDETTSDIIPHAWKAGPQTITLRSQLEAMADGGVVVIAPPDNPFRCPPGPYERASLIANYLKTHKPRSKLLILDAKDKFSKQGLFMQAWEQLYPDMIEWVKGSDGGRIDRVDAATRTLYPEIGDPVTADVINFIPPQKAGAIVHAADLVNNDGWCPVDQRSFASTLQSNIHVIGDAAIAGKMPKSGFAANSQAKVCAAAIVSELGGTTMPDPSYVNTCYSLIAPDYGISVAAVYRLQDGKIVKVEGSGGVSPMDVPDEYRKNEARYARGWYQSITQDTFG